MIVLFFGRKRQERHFCTFSRVEKGQNSPVWVVEKKNYFWNVHFEGKLNLMMHFYAAVLNIISQVCAFSILPDDVNSELEQFLHLALEINPIQLEF